MSTPEIVYLVGAAVAYVLWLVYWALETDEFLPYAMLCTAGMLVVFTWPMWLLFVAIYAPAAWIKTRMGWDQ